MAYSKDVNKKRDPQAKLRHIDACLLKESQYKKSAGFLDIELINEPGSGLALSDISINTDFLGHSLGAPLMIAPMTGGSKLGALLNRRWASAARHFNLAMGVGSQRLAFEDSTLEPSFNIRKYAPNIFLFANIGAAQLITFMKNEDIKKIVDMIEANALFIHLNPLQEAVQENGDTNFNGLLKAIERVNNYLRPFGVPVFVREVCFGLSKKSISLLLGTGISGLDCAGAGGTSWAKVEALCASNEKQRKLAECFSEWGIPTVRSILNVREVSKETLLIATGGIRSGLDVAKCLFLGANLASMAQPMLAHAMDGEESLFSFIEQTLKELKIAMFASGHKDIKSISFLK